MSRIGDIVKRGHGEEVEKEISVEDLVMNATKHLGEMSMVKVPVGIVREQEMTERGILEEIVTEGVQDLKLREGGIMTGSREEAEVEENLKSGIMLIDEGKMTVIATINVDDIEVHRQGEEGGGVEIEIEIETEIQVENMIEVGAETEAETEIGIGTIVQEIDKETEERMGERILAQQGEKLRNTVPVEVEQG